MIQVKAVKKCIMKLLGHAFPTPALVGASREEKEKSHTTATGIDICCLLLYLHLVAHAPLKQGV